MNQNIRIARQLVKLAKAIVASFEDKFLSDVGHYVDEYLSTCTITGKSGISYRIMSLSGSEYDDRLSFRLKEEEPAVIPDDETVDEDELKGIYNGMVAEIRDNLHHFDGYYDIRDEFFSSNENDYMLSNRQYTIDDEDGNVEDVTDEFDNDVEDETREYCRNAINAECLVNPNDVRVMFFNKNGTYSNVAQRLSPGGFEKC